MQYFFIPGRFTELSLAEIKAVSRLYRDPSFTVDATNNGYFLVRTTLDKADIRSLFERLGGFIKFGELIDVEDKDILESLAAKEPKIHGVSAYGDWQDNEARGHATHLNNRLKEYFATKGLKTRFVGDGDAVLSSGSIVGNDLLEKGFEIVILKNKEERMDTGITLMVQDIESFTQRDMEKPAIDTEMGMLPPKLARMMVNLAALPAGATVWDPFCGSGVIPMESILLGYNVLASDISEKAVSDTEKNIHWLGENYDVGDRKYNVFQHDMTQEHRRTEHRLRQTELDGIVFEPYMGPPQLKRIHPAKAAKLVDRVTLLLKQAFERFEYIGNKDLIVVAVVPSYLTYNGWLTPTYMKFLSKKWKILNKKIGNDGLHWKRSNSIITRNLLLVQLKRR
jgi:tRNA G10  N-methylase Trm11